MLYLAFIFHMHQPYYNDLLTLEAQMPWVRLHGTKDYLDMVLALKGYPGIRQTFNLVPSLLEQIEGYVNGTVKDRFLELSYKSAKELTLQEQQFILENFFKINKERVISTFPRYYELFLKNQHGLSFTTQDYLDLQVWFNLAWIDPSFRQAPALKPVVDKARFFSEEEKRGVLNRHIEILKGIIPAYKEFLVSGQIEVSLSPFYHPILPLLHNSNIAREANKKTLLPKPGFSHPEDARAQVDIAVKFFQERFGLPATGMWPSEEAVSEHVLAPIIDSGVKWIVADEAILFKSLKSRKRNTALLYQPHLLSREEGDLNIVFRDRNLSDLIGFVYHRWAAQDAAADLMKHLENISESFKGEDVLVTIAMDGENAWEYYYNDGHQFLDALYSSLSEADFLKTTTVSEYLRTHPPRSKIKRLAAGSWIYGNFGKWIDNPYKVRAWECLTAARQELERFKAAGITENLGLAYKQMHILEGSDWFWWYGEDTGDFDRLFRMHMSNFYNIIGKEAPAYLRMPLMPNV